MIDDEGVQQALVTRRHMGRRRPADEASHHPVERAPHRAPADQRADGDQRTLRASIAARIPGTARIGWIETNGLLGAITMRRRLRSPRARPGRASTPPRRRRRARRPRPRACARRTTPGTRTSRAGVTSASGVGRPWPAGAVSRAPRRREPRRDRRERLSRPQRLRTDEMEPEVEIAEHEPALATPRYGLTRVPATSRRRGPSHAPSSLSPARP